MSSHVHTAAVRFNYPDSTAATIVERAVRIEVDGLDADRSTVTVDRTDTEVAVDVSADDLVALRAALNSWCRYVSVAERVAGCESIRSS